jgi:DNA-binding LytR/AlgR family response regulator
MDDNSLTIIIAEDEAPAREELLHLLKDVKNITVTGIARDGLQAKEMILSLQPDLALLDIEMPGLNGIELARQVLDEGMQTLFIFTTAYNAFAIEAFEVYAVDYLLKPVRSEKLVNAVERVRKQLAGNKKDSEKMESFINDFQHRNKNDSDFISLYKGDQIIPIKLSSILFAEARGRFVWVITNGGEYKTSMNFKEIQEILRSPYFFTCHRSYIIHLESIESIDLWINSSYRLKMKGSETTIPVSRNHKEEFQKLMRI